MKEIFCDKDGRPSSKRYIAAAIVAVVLVCFVHDDFIGKEMPVITEFIMGCAVTLLGIEPVTNVFNNIKNGTTCESAKSDNAECGEESPSEQAS